MDERPTTDEAPKTEDESWPVGFLIIVLLTALYLLWRLVQAIDWAVERGMRIAQLVVAPVTQVAISEADKASDTDRGSGGFGSTGV